MKVGTETVQDLASSGAGLFVHLRALEQLFDQISELAFFVKDDRGCYLAANRSLIERHGRKNREELIGKRPRDICEGPFGEVPTQQDRTILETGRPLVDHLELQWLRPNQPCWCLTTKLPLSDESGKVVGIIGYSKDLQDRVPVKDIPAEIAKVLDGFRSSFGKETSPSALAGAAGVSPSRFAKVVKRVYGVTPSQFITQTRVDAAARMLRVSGGTVAEIAQECGFSDHSAFSRAFRSSIGLSPTEYRKETGASDAPVE
ncbi:MAG: AraC family transcriptional regulator [Verrucomicrobiota bacterium]